MGTSEHGDGHGSGRHSKRARRSFVSQRREEDSDSEDDSDSGSEYDSSSSEDSGSECDRPQHGHKRSRCRCARHREVDLPVWRPRGTPTVETCDAAEVGPEEAARLARTPQGALALAESAWEYLQYVLACGARDDAELCHRLGTDAAHVPCAQLHAGPFRPAFFVCVDDAHRRLVLCVRGSQEAPDAVTDLSALPVPFPSSNGKSGGAAAHGGFLVAARLLAHTAAPLLAALQRAHPSYAVRLVGHSLGGAVAALLTLLLRASLPRARAVVFGVPACVSAALVPEARACVTSFVNADDPLPRLSTASVRARLPRLPAALARTRLVPPGTLLCLCADDGDAPRPEAGTAYARLRVVDAAHFHELVVGDRPVSSHFSEGYEASFRELRSALRERLGTRCVASAYPC